MSAQPADLVGFAHPNRMARQRGQRATLMVEIIATLTLVASIAIAGSMVSIAMGRAGATLSVLSVR